MKKNKFLINCSAIIMLGMSASVDAATQEGNTFSVETVQPIQQLQPVDVNSLPKATGIEVINADSLYNPIDMALYFTDTESLFNKTTNKTETIELLKKLAVSLENLDPNNPKTDSIMKKWLEFEPKLLTIIGKEQQLDELLDYIGRLKKVASSKKVSPVAQKNSCAETKGSEYRFPKCS